jgi:hypothetical protein
MSTVDPSVEMQEPEWPSRAGRKRDVLGMVLDPRNILWLLALGGALMLTGLILLLWVNRFFTPRVIALSLGLGNGALLLGGWGVIRRTRYEMAGRALTLLACLIMPLNLWYYHTNGLLTIDGHLWAAAVCISVLYLASALLLRDELFVYVFAAGLAMTGLLFLADLPPSPQKFWEIASPATLLVAMGLMLLHAERAFPDQEGPFSRKRFGLAFFWSGHALLAGGLCLLLGAHVVAGWLYEFFEPYYLQWSVARTPVVTETWGPILSLCLVIAGAYAYVYSEVVVRRVGIFVYLAAATLLWAEVLSFQILHFDLGLDALIVTLAGTGALANLIHHSARGDRARALAALGLAMELAALGIGLIVYVRALSPDLKSVWQNQAPQWSYVAAMLLTAAACRIGAWVTRTRSPRFAVAYLAATAAATMVAGVAMLATLGLREWHQHAPWMMLLPIAYLVAARVYRGKEEEAPFVWVSHAAAGLMLVYSLASALEGFTHVVEQQSLNLVLALFFAEAALFYGLAAAWGKQVISLHLSAAMACATIWQLLTYAGVAAETYTLTFALVGLGLLVAHRFTVLDRFGAGALADASFQSANTLLWLSCGASIFMGASRLATHDIHWSFVGLCVALLAISLSAMALVRVTTWKRWYAVMALAEALLAGVAIQVLSTLTIYQKLEIFSVTAGIGLLVVGHVGWIREQDRHSDLVSVSLLLGSLLAGVPLAIATLYDRWHDQFLVLNELGFLTVGVLLLATGFIFQLKSTTLTGAALTMLYFMMLLVYVPWARLNTVAIIIIAGGAILFGAGLVLSIYRDRLRTLPARIQRHEGIFAILSWR